jgi:hypothetical protein
MQPSTRPIAAASGEHNLSPEQVMNLANAIQELDAFLVKSVEDNRRNLWVRPETKDIVDYRTRELLVSIITRFIFLPDPLHDSEGWHIHSK